MKKKELRNDRKKTCYNCGNKNCHIFYATVKQDIAVHHETYEYTEFDCVNHDKWKELKVEEIRTDNTETLKNALRGRTMNSVGISADRFNEKMLQIADALKPLGVFVECEKTVDAEINLYPRGTFITKLDVTLCFYSEGSEKQESESC